MATYFDYFAGNHALATETQITASNGYCADCTCTATSTATNLTGQYIGVLDGRAVFASGVDLSNEFEVLFDGKKNTYYPSTMRFYPDADVSAPPEIYISKAELQEIL